MIATGVDIISKAPNGIRHVRNIHIIFEED